METGIQIAFIIFVILIGVLLLFGGDDPVE